MDWYGIIFDICCAIGVIFGLAYLLLDWKEKRKYRRSMSDLEFVGKHIDRIDEINEMWNDGYSNDEILEYFRTHPQKKQPLK